MPTTAGSIQQVARSVGIKHARRRLFRPIRVLLPLSRCELIGQATPDYCAARSARAHIGALALVLGLVLPLILRINEFDRRSPLDLVAKVARIPIGHANAAMRG